MAELGLVYSFRDSVCYHGKKHGGMCGTAAAAESCILIHRARERDWALNFFLCEWLSGPWDWNYRQL